MTLHLPRLPLSVDPLVAEARRRMRQRRSLILAVLLAAAAAGLTFALRSPNGPGPSGSAGVGLGATARLTTHGIGGVHLGASKAQTVADLSRLFGPPTQRFASPACGPTDTEVAWGHLYVEFQRGTFSGYRYMTGSFDASGVYPRPPGDVRPGLATASGVTLGATLRQLRHTYGRLLPGGTFRWQTNGGLTFQDNSKSYPDPPNSRVSEMKYGTCGDF
jgi:hypothetical protein